MLGLLVLTACSSATPVADDPGPASSAPVPSTSVPSAVATTLQFSGSGVLALDDGDAVVSSSVYSDGVGATIDLITVSVGLSPTVSEEVDEGCAGPHSSYRWDGVTVTAWTGSTGFTVGIDAPALGGIRLETTGGFAPGDDVSAFSAAAPPANVGDMGGERTLVAFDVVGRSTDGAYSSPIGAVGYVPDGVILQSVIAPGEWSSFLC